MQVQTNQSTSQANQSTTSLPASANPAVTPTRVTPPSALNHTPTLSKAAVQNQTTANQESASMAELKAELQSKVKRPRSKKQIPTVLGLLVLFVALISGVLLFGQGTGVFAPRATPETAPQNIRITNVTDKTFTISFYTSERTIAFVKYGEDPKSLTRQASDDRDQLSGVVKDYNLHHITVRGLDSAKTYYYVLGTGSNNFDNEGQPYSLATAAKPNQSPVNNQTVYGNVLDAAGSPAEGAVVYLYGEGMGALSSLVKASGSWGISLSNAFNVEKTAYLPLENDSLIDIKAQGTQPSLLSSWQGIISDAAPVPDLNLSQGGASSAATVADNALPDIDKDELLADLGSDSEEASDSTQSSEMLNMEQDQEQAEESSEAAQSNLLATENQNTPVVEEPVVLNLDDLEEAAEATNTTITTTQPQIKATLPANTMVRVVVHSDTQIDETMQTDADGNLVLDVASLGQNLEPGEHSATYTYIDPVTGQEVTKTYNFVVAPEATPRQLAQATTPTPTAVPSIPYGSGNPYTPTTTPTNTPTPEATATPTLSTNSAIVATTSGQYNAGSVGTTIALLLGGLFFILAGVWSYFLANSFASQNQR
jgi:hypothetical protein